MLSKRLMGKDASYFVGAEPAETDNLEPPAEAEVQGMHVRVLSAILEVGAVRRVVSILGVIIFVIVGDDPIGKSLDDGLTPGAGSDVP